LEFWIGLPADQEPRGTTQRMPAPHLEPTPFMLAGPDRESLTAQAFCSTRTASR